MRSNLDCILLAATAALFLLGCTQQPRTIEPIPGRAESPRGSNPAPDESREPSPTPPPTRHAATQPLTIPADTPADVVTAAAVIERDPAAYLRDVEARCAALREYTVVFTRRERRGLLKRMTPDEHIRCWFRRDPFSVRMKWLDPDTKYGESTFVMGLYDNKVRFVPRNGLFGLPPAITEIDLTTPVIWGEAKYPLTDFGLERLMERTLAAMTDAEGSYTLSYEGVTRLDDGGPLVHKLYFEFPAKRGDSPIKEIYISALSGLPVAMILKSATGAIEGAYSWSELNSEVSLTDADFLLEAETTAADSTAPRSDSSSSAAKSAAPATQLAGLNRPCPSLCPRRAFFRRSRPRHPSSLRRRRRPVRRPAISRAAPSPASPRRSWGGRR